MKKLVLAILIGILSLVTPGVTQAFNESTSDGTRAQSVGLLRGEDFSTLNGAINFAAGSNVTLVITQPITILNSATVPSTMTLNFLNGGKVVYDVNASGTVTLAINGPIIAPLGQTLFSGSSLSTTINLATTPNTSASWGTFATTGSAPTVTMNGVSIPAPGFSNPIITGTVTGGANYATPTITNPAFSGASSGSLTLNNGTLPSPIISGTVTGAANYTAPTITNPVFAGKASGSITGATITAPAITNTGTTTTNDIVTKGPWVDVRSCGGFNACITSIGSSQKTLLITDSETMSASVTVPSTLTLAFQSPGMITTTGYNLRINGPLNSVCYQIFSGTGTVSIYSPNSQICPQYWGAKGDGVTDDTVAIQAVINAVNDGMTILIPPSTFIFSSLTITKSITFQGLGWDTPTLGTFGDSGYNTTVTGSVLKSNASSGSAIILTTNNKAPRFKNVAIIGPGNGTATAITFGSSSSYQVRGKWDDVLIANFYQGLILTNVEDYQFDSLRIRGISTNALLLQSGGGGSNTNQNLFNNLEIQRSGTCLKITEASANVFNAGVIQGCTIGINFAASAPGRIGTTVFNGVWFETNTKHISLDITNGAPQSLSFENVVMDGSGDFWNITNPSNNTLTFLSIKNISASGLDINFSPGASGGPAFEKVVMGGSNNYNSRTVPANVNLISFDNNQITSTIATGTPAFSVSSATPSIMATRTPNAGELIGSSVSLNNGAGASAGTILNAPAVGNPTKWIPINDNGVTRYIPAW